MTRKTTLIAMAAALVAAGIMRPVTQATRQTLAPGTAAAGTSAGTLGRLDSAALALVLGGLRGPLVMALWTSTGDQQGQGAGGDQLLGGLDTKLELIRLLQPQFDNVHLQQIFNKAYNISAEVVSPAARYTAVLDGVDYAEKVLDDRPYNVTLETQLYQLYSNKLGSADERDYYAFRVRQETRAGVGSTRMTFPADAQGAVLTAATQAGVSPRELQVRRGQNPSLRTAIVSSAAADAVRAALPELDITLEELVRDTSVEGAALGRLLPVIDAQGNVLPELTQAKREAPEGVQAGEYLDGSAIQFLEEFAPFPEGLSPHALSYEHAVRAYVLQEFAGQKHVLHSPSFVRAAPVRALRDWTASAYEEGRQFEAEAMGRVPPRRTKDGQQQAETELLSADLPLDGSVPFPAMLELALLYYERSQQLAEPSIERIEQHIASYPEAFGTFAWTIQYFGFLKVMLEADETYARLALGEFADDRTAAIARADALYEEAAGLGLDYVIWYHVDADVLPEGVGRYEVQDLPRSTKQQMYAQMQVLRTRARGTGMFEAERVVDEFDGIFNRIALRRQLLANASQAN